MTHSIETASDLQQDYIYALISSPNFEQDGLCFAGRQSGLYRSNDGGLKWDFAYESLNLNEALITTSVLFSPDFMSDQSVFAGAPGGVLRSTDGGQTWQVALLGSPPPVVSALAISPDFLHDGVLFAATLEDGVFRSADRGRRWTLWNFGLLDLRVLCLAISPNFATDETIFAGTESGLFRSTNGGRAWRELSLPIGYEPILSLAISSNFAHDGRLFAGTEQGLFYSRDSGKNWRRLGAKVLVGNVNAILLSPDFATEQKLLVLDDQDDEMPHFSSDGGQSWQPCAVDGTKGQKITAIASPAGFGVDRPIMVGLITGDVLLYRYGLRFHLITQDDLL